MRLIKGNVEREADGTQAEKWMRQGFKALDPTEPESSVTVKEKDIFSMNVKELKALAKEKGVEGAASLNKEELLAVLKDVI